MLLAGTFPWARLRQAQKLLRLAARYGALRLDAACERALSFELLNVSRVEAIVRSALGPLPAGQIPTPVPALPARFVRSAQSFVHSQPQEDRHGDHV